MCKCANVFLANACNFEQQLILTMRVVQDLAIVSKHDFIVPASS